MRPVDDPAATPTPAIAPPAKAPVRPASSPIATVTTPANPAPAPAPAKVATKKSSGGKTTDQQIRDYIATHYGYLSAFLDMPEVGAVLINAAKNHITDPNLLLGMLSKTHYWKTTSDTARQFDAEYKLDYASNHQKREQSAQRVRDMAAQLGVKLSLQDSINIGTDALRFGWDTSLIQHAIGQHGIYVNTVTAPGQQGTTVALASPTADQIRAWANQYQETLTESQIADLVKQVVSGTTTLAQIESQMKANYVYDPTKPSPVADQVKAAQSQYLVPMTDADIATWTKNITTGLATQDQFTAWLKEQATSLFPGMAGAIGQGVTPETYVAPYKNIASQMLEVPSDSINFMDPKWGKALFQVDPKTGARTSMSLSDWQTLLRTDPSYGWDKTENARTSAADLTTALAQRFGVL